MPELTEDAFLLVASDVHSGDECFEKLCKIAGSENCLAFLYAGDLDIENYFITRSVQLRNFVFLPVQGNCDNRWDWTDVNLDLPLYRTCTFKGLKIFISHGHLYYEPSSVGLEDKDFDLVISGHSHSYNISTEIIEGKRVIYMNPGSPSRPRGCRSSYGLVVFGEDGSVSLEIRALDGDGLLAKETITVDDASVGNN
ncbi:MAG: metallophosphoesterase family protein [Spirochaetales bacterium]|nr:metallophosphoesterase family protein [Spirochaetales bacterium]